MKYFLYAALVIVASSLIFLWKSTNREHYRLIIGILSSREHFSQRCILRENINKLNQNILLRFIVAEKPCLIPYRKRIDSYGCEMRSFEDGEIKYLHKIDIEPSGIILNKSNPVGVDFVLRQDVIINEIGIFDHGHNGIKGNVKVMIYNKVSMEPIFGIVILPFSQGKLNGAFIFKKINNGTLRKGFQGSLVVEGMDTDDLMFFKNNCSMTSSGAFKLLNGLRFGHEKGEFPVNFLKHTGCLVGPSLSYYSVGKEKESSDIDHLKRIANESDLIYKEVKEYGDLILVDTVECYRSLPMKMMLFYKELSTYSFDYILKSDDDCFVNVSGILDSLDITPFDQESLWIGNFRENFAIERHGKWAELDYNAVSYPPFACGSGYVLSFDIVNWIARNINSLKIYQGEDTSLGIWLSAIDVNRIQDSRFQCARTCKENIFTLPENNVKQLKHLYSSLSNICDK